jgi:hypothetical protein
MIVSSAFLIDAILSIFIHYPERIRADLATLSAGIFFSTISFSLIDAALRECLFWFYYSISFILLSLVN